MYVSYYTVIAPPAQYWIDALPFCGQDGVTGTEFNFSPETFEKLWNSGSQDIEY